MQVNLLIAGGDNVEQFLTCVGCLNFAVSGALHESILKCLKWDKTVGVIWGCYYETLHVKLGNQLAENSEVENTL